MSFRRRNDIISTPTARGDRNGTDRPHNPLINRAQGLRNDTAKATNLRGGIQREPREKEAASKEQIFTNKVCIRPSTLTSQPTTSTGIPDLDKVLLHQGIPLGNSLLVEESGSTDFSSVLLRCFAAQGIMHDRVNRNEKQAHVLVVGFPDMWAMELPGLYKGSSKEQAKAKIAENESRLSVSNLADESGGPKPRSNSDMKIAWRYGLKKKSDIEKADTEDTKDYNADNNNPHYVSQFDITQRIAPHPNNNEISFIPASNDYLQIIKLITLAVENLIKKNPTQVIRIVIPSFLHPTFYQSLFTSFTSIIPFLHCLRSLLRRFSQNLVLIMSISLQLYSRESHTILMMEHLMDGVILLQPFNQEMTELLERAYKNEPSKIQQGFLHIYKIPVLSERGHMLIHEGEYAFKNGRKRFEIEEWSIPVEEEEKENQNNESSTTANLEF